MHLNQAKLFTTRALKEKETKTKQKKPPSRETEKETLRTLELEGTSDHFYFKPLILQTEPWVLGEAWLAQLSLRLRLWSGRIKADSHAFVFQVISVGTCCPWFSAPP